MSVVMYLGPQCGQKIQKAETANVWHSGPKRLPYSDCMTLAYTFRSNKSACL